MTRADGQSLDKVAFILLQMHFQHIISMELILVRKLVWKFFKE